MPECDDRGVTAELDRDVRLFVYRHFLGQGQPPTFEQTAEALGCSAEEAEGSFRRLEAGRVLVFAPGTLDIWMANPLSAFPTPFWVETEQGSWWGTCIWDALGIPAMLAEDATISTSCPDCSEPFELRVESDALQPAEGVAHFALPARRWWQNIGYT
jgi:alkylmercury lyase-like protein